MSGDPASGKTTLCQVYANKGHFTSDYNMVD
jgi:dephospho-CoA kinase